MKISDITGALERAESDRIEHLLQGWNATATAYPREATVHGLFAQPAARNPDRTAVRHGADAMTYGELDRRSNQVAHYLQDCGLAPEAFAGLWLAPCLGVAPVLLGILKAGGAYLPIDPDSPVERAAYQLTEAGCRTLFSATSQLPQLEALRAHCPELQVICLDLAGPPPAAGIHGAAVLATAATAHRPERAGPTSLACLIYTSGTSGRPKGALIEHRAMVRLVRDTNYLDIREDDCFLQTGSLAFDASTFEIWGPLLNGAALTFPERAELLDAGELERLLARDGISILFLTTSLFNLYAGLKPDLFRGLRVLLTGGEKVSVTHVNRVRAACPGLRLLHVYGPTENTTFTTFQPVEGPYEGDVPIGRPIANTTVHILDQALQPVGVGVQGEIYTGGDGLARGYLNDPELTAAKFVPDPRHPGGRLYRTGDLGCWLPDGSVRFIARADQQLKIRGFRVEPAEIEHFIRLQPGVQDVAVVGKGRTGEGLELCAYLAAEATLDIAALREALRQGLPGYMVPTHVVRLEQLPLNASGKVDRAALPDPWAATAAHTAQAHESSATEAALLALWREVLGREDIGLDEDFFDLGGHSLKATKLSSLIQKRLGLSLPLTAVFEYPTVAQLARFLVDSARFGAAIADASMVRMNRAQTGVPLFLFPPGTGDALSFAQLAEALDAVEVYGFNFLSADTRSRDYADLILGVDPVGPYRLAGYSGGGNLAYDVARELEARGRRVAALVMFDSARHLVPVHYSREAAQQLARDFMDDDSVRSYLSSVVLQDKVIRRIEDYYAAFSTRVDDQTVDCPIHVICSDDSPDEHRDAAGTLLVSTLRWAEVTRGGWVRHAGHGGHNRMLYEPFVGPNALLLTRLLTET